MINILAISDSDKHFWSAIQEYEKRLWKLINIQNIKPYKWENSDFVVKKDTENIIEILTKKFWSYFKVLLSKDGKSLDTFWIQNIVKTHPNIVFIIWWPYGLDEKMLEPQINEKISFGKITLPHGLAKLVLVEQLYRSWTIHTGKSYHY